MRDILAAIAIFVNGAKGSSALQLARDLSVDYKTAFVLLHKVRESIELARDGGALSGNVEVDGTYFGGYVKPTNEVADRKDRHLKRNQSGKRQVVLAIRETNGRTITSISKTEAEGVALVRANVAPGSTVHADQASHWDKLAAHFPIKRIDHSVAYSKDGACTNMAGIHRRGPWRSFEAVEYVTLEWVDWFNNRRLLELIGNIPPTGAEAHFYTALETETMAA